MATILNVYDQSAIMASPRLKDSKATAPADTATFVKGCYQQGIYYLQHETPVYNLSSILASGFILPRSKQSKRHLSKGGNPDVAYLAIYTAKGPNTPVFDCPKPIDNRDSCFVTPPRGMSEANALLIFSVQLLIENNNYFANPVWDYGKQIAHNSVPSSQIQQSKGSALSSRAEICFSGGIDLSKYLVEIWIHPHTKDAVIADLSANKQLNKDKWIPKIVEQEFHPELVVAPSRSIPQRMKDSLGCREVCLFKRSYPAGAVSPEKAPSDKGLSRTC